MGNLELHKTGKIDFIKSLKEKYDKLREKALKDKSISDSKRENELKRINEDFEKQKKDSKSSLF